MKQITKTTPILSDYSLEILGIHMVPEFTQFTIWFATPSQLRKYKTQKDFAVSIGVSQDTLTDWKKHPQFWPMVKHTIAESIRESIPDAIDSLRQNVMTEGKAGDVALFLRLANMDSDINNNSKKHE